MPRKIRQLIADLEKHGFVDRGGKGSHRNFLHPSGVKITLSGAAGDDAKHYQERDLKRAIQKVQSWARHLIAMWKSLPGVKKISATLVAAPALCLAEYMAATNRPSTQSCVKRSMNGFDCTKPKADRSQDRHLFAKSKRLFDFIVEGEKRYGLHPAMSSYGEASIAIDRFEGVLGRWLVPRR
jgi:predicted RNA binding protein YcfA (HicA-like mRNA interferase family)